jgi:tRNA(fMet)-specific endonuclease VapC
VRYLLDTNACIKYVTERSEPVLTRMRRHGPSEVALCAVVKSELLFGAHKSSRRNENLAALTRFFEPFVSYSVDDAAAEIAGRVRATLDAQGSPIGPNDLLIAAVALANGLTLVTHNVTEFGRVPELTIEDWELPE